MHCRTPEDEARSAWFAKELHHADYCKAHPEDLTASLHPTIAQAFAPLMFPMSVIAAVSMSVEQAAVDRMAGSGVEA